MSLFTQVVMGKCAKCGIEVSLNTLRNHDCPHETASKLTAVEGLPQVGAAYLCGYEKGREKFEECMANAMELVRQRDIMLKALREIASSDISERFDVQWLVGWRNEAKRIASEAIEEKK